MSGLWHDHDMAYETILNIIAKEKSVYRNYFAHREKENTEKKRK